MAHSHASDAKRANQAGNQESVNVLVHLTITLCSVVFTV